MKKKNTGFELKKVLMIVEDFDFIRSIVGKSFQIKGYDIISAGNMQEAMAIGQWDQPHILFVDFDMSNDSYLTVSALHTILPLSQIILVNGRNRHCDIGKEKTAGANKILERLFNPEVLEEIIHNTEVEAVHS